MSLCVDFSHCYEDVTEIREIANHDVGPDGQRFVMVKNESSADRLNVVLNWTEELR